MNRLEQTPSRMKARIEADGRGSVFVASDFFDIAERKPVRESLLRMEKEFPAAHLELLHSARARFQGRLLPSFLRCAETTDCRNKHQYRNRFVNTRRAERKPPNQNNAA